MLSTLPSTTGRTGSKPGYGKFGLYATKNDWLNDCSKEEEKTVSFSLPEEAGDRWQKSSALVMRRKDDSSLSSVCLSCISSDGRTVLSFGYNEGGDACIMAHSLPLSGTTSSSDDGWESVTVLPSHVGKALDVDEALALICVEHSNRPCDGKGSSGKLLPCVCLYSRQCAWLMQMDVCGKLVQLVEPFESHLLSTQSSIVRIRPAPCDTILCAPGSMALLTDEGTLVLFHGIHDGDSWESVSSSITTPVTCRLEECTEDAVVDFCFCSKSNNIFSSLMVVFTTGQGLLYFASPVLFHGAVLPRAHLQHGLAVLNQIISDNHDHDADPCSIRRAKAAKQYLLHAFPSLDKPNYYVTAQIAHVHTTTSKAHSSYRNATAWPIQMQGPISSIEEELPSPPVITMELLPASDNTAAVVLARVNHSLDYIIIPSGDILLPRFAFESPQDATHLNDLLIHDFGAILIDRILLDNQHKDSNSTPSSISLQIDPIDSSMIHHISNKRIISISTNVIAVMTNKMNNPTQQQQQQQQQQQVRTSAWSTLQISTGGTSNHTNTSLHGVVISSDVQLGHVLIARISNGSMEAVNITASRYLHQASNINLLIKDETTSQSQYGKTKEQVPPFVDVMEPLFHKITKGISGLGKIVGGSTPLENIEAGSLATFLATKQNCEQNIILPIFTLHELIQSRKKMLHAMYQQQITQLKKLQSQIQQWKQNELALTKQKMMTITKNSDLLAQRSAAVLSVTRELSPTITEAEYQYFTQLRRYDASCHKWQDLLERMADKANAMKETPKPCAVQLDSQQIELCTTLLKGQEKLLDRNTLRVKEIETKLKTMLNK